MKNTIIYPFLIVGLGICQYACTSGSGASTAGNSISGAINQVTSVFSSGSGVSRLEVVDLDSLDYNLELHTIESCSADNSVCASITRLPSGSYTQQKWVIHDAVSSITLNFKTDMSKDYHLSQITNDLSSNLTNVTVGRVSQIDTSLCDKLVADGSTAGKSCKIYFTYTADGQTTVSDQLNLNWSWDQGQKNMQLSFPIQNKETDFPYANPPVLTATNTTDPLLIYIPSSENTNGTGLEYPIQIYDAINLFNQGPGILPASGSATIKATRGQQFDSAPDAVIENLNPLFTTCGTNAVEVNDQTHICNFPFVFIPQDTRSAFVNLVFQYANPQVNYMRRTVLSIGDIIPDNVVANFSYARLKLAKHIVEGDHLSYSIPLSNFSLHAKYDATTDIATSYQGSQLVYGYGDFRDTTSGKMYKANDLINTLQLQYDQACFTRGLDPNYDTPGATTNKCEIYAAFKDGIKLDRPIKVNLYANYDTPTQNRAQVEQYIGSITFFASSYASSECTIKYIGQNSYAIPSGTEMQSMDCFIVVNPANNKAYKLLHEKSGDLSIYACDSTSKMCNNKTWGSVGAVGGNSYTQFSDGHIYTFSPGYVSGLKCTEPCTMYWNAWMSDRDPIDNSRKYMFNTDGTLTIVKDNTVVWSSATSNGYIRDGNNFYPVSATADQPLPW